MARGKAISVKIATPKVIKALETKLAELETNWANQEANEAKYQESYKAWQKELADFAIAHFANAENIRTNYRSWNKTLNVDFSCDKSVNFVNFSLSYKKLVNFDKLHLSFMNFAKFV